jgi:hypothetical protein
MKSIRPFYCASLAVAATLACFPATAATVSECIADAQIVQDTINAATTFTTLNDQVALAGKAGNVMQKLDKANFTDALKGLAGITDQVGKLVATNKPKLGADDAAAITAEVDVASVCVTQLLTQ